MTFFLFRRVAIGNRNSGIKQTFWSKVMKSWRKGFKALSLPTHSATKLMSNLPEKSWASARSSSLSNWRVCWLWSFHRVSKVAPKGGHNLRPPHGERESTRKLGSKKLVHKIFLLRKWRENGVECPPSKGSFEGWLESPELAISVIDSLCPRLSNGPIPSFIRFFPQKLAFLKLGETGRNGTDLLLKKLFILTAPSTVDRWGTYRSNQPLGTEVVAQEGTLSTSAFWKSRLDLVKD